MIYTIFPKKKNNPLDEPMFMGNPVNVARYDQQRYPRFEQLIEQQLSFFWRPEEIDLSKDRIDFQRLHEHEQHIFLSNLKYQTLLDSIQGRSPNVVFLPLVSLPELETWITTWTFSETIHSRSYTHIIRNLVPEPSKIFEEILETPEIIERAQDITQHYDNLMDLNFKFQASASPTSEISPQNRRALKKALYLCMVSVNVLEAIRFYVSFACSFAFAEREKMEGNAKIIKLIARDESLHLAGTQYILSVFRSGLDDPEMAEIADICRPEAQNLFLRAAEQEKAWAGYLFNQGSMLGLNETILKQYIDHITTLRMRAVGLLPSHTPIPQNPIPWINHWLSSDHVQVAPQEVEISSYLTGQIDASIGAEDFKDITL